MPTHAQPTATVQTRPQFIFAKEMGKKSIDEIETDLMLITVLAGMEVPRDLRARDSKTGEMIKQAIKSQGFQGTRDDRLLVETQLPTTTAQSGRKIFVAGLGRRDNFCARASYLVFEALLQEAMNSGVKRITVPFTPNRGTGSCLSMKAMAHQLNLALNACYENMTEAPALAEVQIYCTPQASAHILHGLSIAEPVAVCC